MTREFLRLQKNCVKVLNNINKSAYGASSDIWYFAHTIQIIKQKNVLLQALSLHFSQWICLQTKILMTNSIYERIAKKGVPLLSQIWPYISEFYWDQTKICPSENDIKIARGVAIYYVEELGKLFLGLFKIFLLRLSN